MIKIATVNDKIDAIPVIYMNKQDIGQINALNVIGIKETPIHLNNHKGVIMPLEVI
jgi:hypothetical protein